MFGRDCVMSVPVEAAVGEGEAQGIEDVFEGFGDSLVGRPRDMNKTCTTRVTVKPGDTLPKRGDT